MLPCIINHQLPPLILTCIILHWTSSCFYSSLAEVKPPYALGENLCTRGLRHPFFFADSTQSPVLQSAGSPLASIVLLYAATCIPAYCKWVEKNDGVLSLIPISEPP